MSLGTTLALQLIFFGGWTAVFNTTAFSLLIAISVTGPAIYMLSKTNLDLIAANRKLDQLACTDGLTEVANRRAFMDRVVETTGQSRTLAIVDLDHFRLVNDTHGHWVGDAVIREVAQRLRAAVGDLGLLARIGGEEFALLAVGEDPEAVIDALEAARTRIAREPFVVEGRSLRVTVSIGVAEDDRGLAAETFRALAKTALGQAKAAGRDRMHRAGAKTAALCDELDWLDDIAPHPAPTAAVA